MADDFEQLRQKSMRSASSFEDVDELSSGGGSGFLGQFTPVQRIILGVLVIVDVLVIAYVILAITGRI